MPKVNLKKILDEEVAKGNVTYCYIKVPELTDGQFLDKWRLARVYENVSGYYPYGKKNKDDLLEIDKFVGSADYVDAIVNAWNEKLGITEQRAFEIEASTTF
tara:strand:- start:243 stop:548 length:306 start_codon:yes stop_codon:yes gene_type:complete